MTGISDIARRCLPVVSLVLLVLAVYAQVGGHSFVNFDDPQYVLENPMVRQGLTPDGAAWALATDHFFNWHPVTWLSHMLDVELFGVDAGAHLRVNAGFHAANALLLFFVLSRMTGAPSQSWFVAALFAVHPLHVESVAWVAERKDVLSAFFWFLTMWGYASYATRPGAIRYLGVVLPFALGLMSKPTLVTLPFVLLLLDYWPLHRLGTEGSSAESQWTRWFRLAREKIPLFALSAISGAVTYAAQAKGGAVTSLEHIGFLARASNAVVSCAQYLLKTAWPARLAVIYPHPGTVGMAFPAWKIAGAALLLGGISSLVWRQRRSRPYLATGWLWYLGTLVPMAGLVQVGSQSMADRYTYIPLIGVFIAATWGVCGLWKERNMPRPGPIILGGALILVLAATAWRQTGNWRNDFTLYGHALEVTEGNWLAWHNLGWARLKSGKNERAIEAFREALRIHPGYQKAWINLGKAYGLTGEYSLALPCFREAVRLNPNDGEAWMKLGIALGHAAQYAQAEEALVEAVRIRPDDWEAWVNLGVAYAWQGKREKLHEVYLRLRRLNPGKSEELLARAGLAK